jgi:hypothetical protein
MDVSLCVRRYGYVSMCVYVHGCRKRCKVDRYCCSVYCGVCCNVLCELQCLCFNITCPLRTVMCIMRCAMCVVMYRPCIVCVCVCCMWGGLLRTSSTRCSNFGAENATPGPSCSSVATYLTCIRHEKVTDSASIIAMCVCVCMCDDMRVFVAMRVRVSLCSCVTTR